jgi:hypothetical protein
MYLFWVYAVWKPQLVLYCRMVNDAATINKESTNEKRTDIDPRADARRLRINGKPCSKQPAGALAGSR